MKELEWSWRETVPLICIYVYIYCCLQKCRIENHLKDSAFIPLIIRNPNNYTPKKRRIGHFAWYSNHTMSQWVKLRGEFAAYSFVSQQMALYLCIAV